jgi:hypothetical protein
MSHLSAVHQQLTQKGLLRRTASWNWDTHRWSGGAFAWLPLATAMVRTIDRLPLLCGQSMGSYDRIDEGLNDALRCK